MVKIGFRGFFYRLPKSLATVFGGKNLLWQALAAAVTFACVTSGFDWLYYTSNQSPALQAAAWPSVWLGFYVPILAPVALLIFGGATKSWRALNTAFALTQAAAVGWAVSALYKFFTGRTGPEGTAHDVSRMFRFGLGRGGVFNGWPSSHTTVAFAMSAALFTLYPKSKLVGYAALAYAAYIGLGVSVTIHWFSDFVAGVIFGSIVGIAVGKNFLAGQRLRGSSNR